MINQDSTLNSAQNPAAQGSYVTIYATGLNNTAPPLATGSAATAAAPLALASELSVWSGNGAITYAGAAPGMAAGITQINLELPASGPAGPVLLTLMVNGSDLLISTEAQFGVYYYQSGAAQPRVTFTR
jgi:uncharacterized protein (TIGR03437 family)